MVLRLIEALFQTDYWKKYLDNQIHVAHNVKIGKNCISWSGEFAGSSSIGNNVLIGGQAEILVILKLEAMFKLVEGGMQDLPDNSKVMGYPAKSIKQFLKDSK